MAEKGWHTVTLPDSLMDEVQRILDLDILGYRTKFKFIKEAIRQRMLDLRKTEILKDDHPH